MKPALHRQLKDSSSSPTSAYIVPSVITRESREDLKRMDVLPEEQDSNREEPTEANRGVRFLSSHPEEGDGNVEQDDTHRQPKNPSSANILPDQPGIASALRSSTVHPNVLQINKAPSSPSVFERLAKTETVASIQAKFLPRKNRGRRSRSSSEPPPKNRERSRTKSDDNAKSQSKQKNTINSISPRKSSNKNYGAMPKASRVLKQSSDDAEVSLKDVGDLAVKKSKLKTVLSKPISIRRGKSYPVKGANKPVTIRKGRPYKAASSNNIQTKSSFETGEEGPPLSIEFSKMMRLICSNKYTPELGFVELDLKPLGLVSAFNDYATGSITSKNLAAGIINALFLRDLPEGISWIVHEPLERELVMPIGEEGYSFFVDATASKFDDDYSAKDNTEGAKYNRYTASATGSVTFVPVRSEIHVENYSCVNTVYDDDNDREGLEGFTF